MKINMEENSNHSKLKLILKNFKNSVKAPERYLRLQNDQADANKLIVKSLYDYMHSNNTGTEQSNNMNLMPTTLIIDDMDDEQIWQQLELQNDTFWNGCLKKTAHLLSINEDKLKLPLNNHEEEKLEDERSSQDVSSDDDDDDDDKESDDGEQRSDNDDDDDDDDIEAEEDEEYKIDSKKIFKKSIVDDNFFNLNEMNDFLEAEDKKEMAKQNGKLIAQDDDNAIDYFKSDGTDQDDDDDDDDSEPKYADFYERTNHKKNETDLMKVKRIQGLREQRNRRAAERKRADLGIESDGSEVMIDENHADDIDEEKNGKRKVKFDMSKNTMKSDSDDNDNDDDDDDSGEDTDDNKNKSSHQEREERLRTRIEQLEEKAMADKPWQLKGEIDSTSRPQNSLLEEILEFDSTTRPPPIITEQTTLKLEDLIKQRIKDKAWDDVQRKFKPQNTPQEFRKKLVLDQEKSKESLAQIYEREYLQEINKMGGDGSGKTNTTQIENSEEPKEHTEIRELMKSLMTKLDALSNFYYTPKPMAPEIRIITNIPAIDMEEVAPVAVSDATLLAPEEIRARPKGDVIGKSERNKTDKNRERRHKKLKQKAHKKIHEQRAAEREALGLGKHEKDAKRDALDMVLKHRNVEKMKINSTSKSLKSSKAFFAQLQDDTVTGNGKTGKRSMNRKDKDNVKSAKKLKL